jgi:YqjK-like protein
VAKTLAELHQEQGRLRERIAAQRVQMGAHLAPLRGALDSGDRAVQAGRDAFDMVSRHPIGVAVLAAVLLAVKPRTVWRWGTRALVGWRSWRALADWLPDAFARMFSK